MGHPQVNPAELKQWLDLAKSGDETAFSRIIELTQDHLFRFCFYVCGDRQRSEDLCQETYIKALTRLESVDDAHHFMGWLFRVAKNHFIDSTRSAASKAVSVDVTQLDSLSTNDDQDQVMVVRECMAQLSEEERMVIVLVDSEGHSYSEAAEIIGITEESLKSRLHRARKAFVKIFNKS